MEPFSKELDYERPEFKTNGEYDVDKHADAIWADIQRRIAAGEKVALIYSANDNQAQIIHASNRNGKAVDPNTFRDGAGQAVLFQKLAQKIQQSGQSDKVRILPVATSQHGGKDDHENKVGKKEIDRDMDAIAQHRADGWSITGPGSNGRFSIGGGVSINWPTETRADLDGKTARAYVNQKLQSISQSKQTQQPSAKLNTPPNKPAQGTQNQEVNRVSQATHQASSVPPSSTQTTNKKDISNQIKEMLHKIQRASDEGLAILISEKSGAKHTPKISNTKDGVVVSFQSEKDSKNFLKDNGLKDNRMIHHIQNSNISFYFFFTKH